MAIMSSRLSEGPGLVRRVSKTVLGCAEHRWRQQTVVGTPPNAA